jgi:hypothetical protein
MAGWRNPVAWRRALAWAKGVNEERKEVERKVAAGVVNEWGEWEKARNAGERREG